MNIVDSRWLDSHPLPLPHSEADKEERGRLFVIGGSEETPGAVLLAGLAALRAGAGKLRLGTVPEVARELALAVPDARVFGCLHGETLLSLRELTGRCRSVLFGSGVLDSDLVQAALPSLLDLQGTLVLDGLALRLLEAERLQERRGPTILTPHQKELEQMMGLQEIVDPWAAAAEAQRLTGAVVVLKGPVTRIAGPAARIENRTGNVGLATSGSGDVLAGLIAGLAARGVPAFEAAVWGVHLHAVAGDLLAREIGPVGFLAREIAEKVPGLMARAGRV